MKKFDFDSINSTIAHILYNFLISEKCNRSNYKFYDVCPDLKFVDIFQESFNTVIDNGINSEKIFKNLAVYYINDF